MKTPIVITNFKTYQAATHERAVDLAKIHAEVAEETGKSLAVCPQTIDLGRVADEVDIPVFAQHMDPVIYGSNTGHVLPEALKAYGVTGVLINHSEHRIPHDVIGNTVKRAKEVNLITIVCAKDPAECEAVLAFDPDYVAYEPPELIGGDISVSSAKPEFIEEAAKRVGSQSRPGRTKLIVGAGVKNSDDVKIAVELGAVGVLIASGVTKSKDPKATLLDLVSVL